jgi:hypothetical protein
LNICVAMDIDKIGFLLIYNSYQLIPIVDEIFDTFVVIFINFINNLKTIVDAIFIKKKR